MQTHWTHRRRPPAIVIGLDDGTTGIQTARILSRRNVPVIGIAGNPRHHCCRTRVCEQILFADTRGQELIPALEHLGPQLDQKAVLFPCQDTNVLLVSRNRPSLERWYHVVLPRPDLVELMMDKLAFYPLAQDLGFSIPRSLILRNGRDAEKAGTELDFPVVLKPTMRSPKWMKHTVFKAFKVSTPRELVALYHLYSRWAEAMIAQQWIDGPDVNHFSCNCYFNRDSEPLATFTTRKLRQWPEITGQGCLGQECRNDLVLGETLRLFQSLRFYGLGYLEMKQDQRTAKYFIIEPNVGRPTGRSATAEAGGVELLYTMYCDALGWQLPSNREQQYQGVKWIYLRQDFQAALSQWRRGQLTLKQWWRSWRGRKTYALLSWRDPVPFLSDLLRVFLLLCSPQERRKRTDPSPLPEASAQILPSINERPFRDQ